MSHHEQQASEREKQPQHHELWPAYNAIAVREQASSQVLLQQTRLFAAAICEQPPTTHFYGLPTIRPSGFPKKTSGQSSARRTRRSATAQDYPRDGDVTPVIRYPSFI
jgi:hypothetical protein